MDRERKRQILRTEAYYAQLDQLGRRLAECGFYVLGGVQPGTPGRSLPEAPLETDAAPDFWETPESR